MLPVIAAIAMLYYFQDKLRKPEEIGLGEGNVAYFPVAGTYPIHISDASDIDTLKKGWLARGSKKLYLWLGNSQLHGINKYMPGNTNTVGFLFNNLQNTDADVAGVSYPNANLQEFLVSVLYYSKVLPLQGIIMPVFYDDMREDGIRDLININPVVKAIQQDSAYFAGIPGIKKLNPGYDGIPSKSDESFNAVKETAQDVSERYLEKKMEDVWGIWKSRPEYRGNLFNALYLFRNSALGIKPTSTRKMIPGRFTDNYNAFKEIVRFCSDKKLPLLIYIPPLRNDVTPPYDIKAYNDFKKNIEQDCISTHTVFINLERLIPNKYWGMKVSSSSYNDELEFDFMHFQDKGHKLLADTIFKSFINGQ